MRTVAPTLLVACCLMAGCVGQEADVADPSQIEGAWRLVETATTGPGGATDTSPEPGLRLFVDGHFSLMNVAVGTPRPILPESASTAERAASLRAIGAQAGTYEVAGETLTMHPTVAKNPSVMDPRSFNSASYQIFGDTLSIRQVENDAGPMANPVAYKFLRMGSATSRSPIDGAWRTVAITTTGPDGTVNASPEPGIRLYVGGHYAFLQLTRPRPPQPDATATDEDLITVWGALAANSGPYEVVGDTVRSRAFVAMNPAAMGRTGAAVRTWRIEGDTLWLTEVADEDGPIANPTTETHVRAK